MEIVLIHSYKGGSGKTTISVNLANILSTTFNKKVLLIETDFKMPSFFVIFKELHPKHYLNEFYRDNPITLSETIVSYNTNLDLIFSNPDYDPQDPIHSWDKAWHAVRLKRLRDALSEFKTKNKYDYIIFDTPPGLHFLIINNIALANHAVIIVRPNAIAVEGTIKMINDLYFKAKSPSKIHIYIVFNQIPRVPMTKQLNEWDNVFTKMQLIPASRIPCSCMGSYDMARGINIFPPEHEINRYMAPLISHLRNEPILDIIDPTINFKDTSEFL